MASFDFEADRQLVKAMRASERAGKLTMKRSEYTRPRGSRDWVWGRSVDEAKPHRNARVATRTCLAKGAVEAQEDMPSIVNMSGTRRRKPHVAHFVHKGKAPDIFDKPAGDVYVSEVETTADERHLGFETESPQESPASGPQIAPEELLAAELGIWPALQEGDGSAAASMPSDKPSHREVALRFVEEHREEVAAAERLRTRKVLAAKAARQANVWKTSLRRRQRLQAVKKALAQSEAKASVQAVQERSDVEDSFELAAPDDYDDHDAFKMERANQRAAKMYIKNAQYTRPYSSRDWVWGRSVEEAKPHRNARVAMRKCLAKGIVEAPEDMPSIVNMSGTRRQKPKVAHVVKGVHYDAVDEGCDEE